MLSRRSEWSSLTTGFSSPPPFPYFFALIGVTFCDSSFESLPSSTLKLLAPLILWSAHLAKLQPSAFSVPAEYSRRKPPSQPDGFYLNQRNRRPRPGTGHSLCVSGVLVFCWMARGLFPSRPPIHPTTYPPAEDHVPYGTSLCKLKPSDGKSLAAHLQITRPLILFPFVAPSLLIPHPLGSIPSLEDQGHLLPPSLPFFPLFSVSGSPTLFTPCSSCTIRPHTSCCSPF